MRFHVERQWIDSNNNNNNTNNNKNSDDDNNINNTIEFLFAVIIVFQAKFLMLSLNDSEKEPKKYLWLRT